MGSTGNQDSGLQHEIPIISCHLDFQGRQLRQRGIGTVSDPASMDRAKPAVLFMHTVVAWGALKKGLGSWT